MKLIGPPNSPYVRRTAISLTVLNEPFERVELSPFRDWEAFHRINPVVKGPSLVLDNGDVLMDSCLILQYIEARNNANRSLWPSDPTRLASDFRMVGLALAAYEKSIQISYELRLRPESARFQPWLDRVRAQATAAFEALEETVNSRGTAFRAELSHASICAAVAWKFVETTLEDFVEAEQYPALVALSEALEATPEFQKNPLQPSH